MRRLRWFWAVLVFLVLYTGIQTGRLAYGAPPSAVWALTVAWFWLLFSWQFIYRARPGSMDSWWFKALAAVGSVATGVWATFVLLSLPLDAAEFARWLWRGGPGPTRAETTASALTSLVVAVLGLLQARAGPVLRVVDVPIEGLPPALEGLRVVQLSDLHVGPSIRAGYVADAAALAMSAAPDLIAVTGDLADGTVEALSKHLEPLRILRAPLGVFYVTGNHEYYWGALPWLEKARELGWIPLVDENRVVERGGDKVLVGGVADPAGEHFIPAHRGDVNRAAASGVAAGLNILLAHRPEACDAAEKAGFQLQLSGHTHGGQFFPFSLLVGLVHRYRRGLHRHGRLWVHVNPGTGYWGPPHRFGVAAEVTVLRLAAV